MVANALQRIILESQRTVVVLVLVLVLIAVLTAIVVTPIPEVYAPRSLPRAYEATPLAAVIRDLEKNEAIQSPTEWEAEELETLPVTASWIWPTDKEVLHKIALAADVVIDYPFEYHGQIDGPVIIRSKGVEQAGLYAVAPNGFRSGPWPHIDRRVRSQ